MPIPCGCAELPSEVPNCSFQQFIWLAAEAEDVIDTKEDWIVRCGWCGQLWRGNDWATGIAKVDPSELPGVQ